LLSQAAHMQGWYYSWSARPKNSAGKQCFPPFHTATRRQSLIATHKPGSLTPQKTMAAKVTNPEHTCFQTASLNLVLKPATSSNYHPVVRLLKNTNTSSPKRDGYWIAWF